MGSKTGIERAAAGAQWWLGMPALLLGCFVFASATMRPEAVPASEPSASEPTLPDPAALMERAQATASLLSGVEGYYEEAVAPLERVLRRQGGSPELSRRIAVAIVRESNRAGVDPRVLTAVMLVENPMLDTLAQSPVGARGLMQIMPLHRGRWSACPGPMTTVDANVCYGARIFASNLRASKGNVEQALLRYNGCVNGTNTPDCHLYPQHVYTRVNRVRSMSARPAVGRAAAP